MSDYATNASSATDPLVGKVVEGRYQVLRRIGGGGMGVVYLARHLRLGREFALKVVSLRHAPSEELWARFRREAMAAASVGHPNIVDVTDMGHLEDGRPFLVQEHLLGTDLHDRVVAHGPLSVRRAVHIAVQLCDALAAVHARHIVHRDLKPDNVMLIERQGDSDFVKLLDFGVCKLLEGDAESAAPRVSLTRSNVSLGTPEYMSPEQLNDGSRVDERTDLHAVGAVLYFMLAGRPLYEADNFPLLCVHICTTPPASVRDLRPDVPEALDQLIRKACAKDPAARFPNAQAMAVALRALPPTQADDAPELGLRAALALRHATTLSLPEDIDRSPAPAVELTDESPPQASTTGLTLSARGTGRLGKWWLATAASILFLLWLSSRFGSPGAGAGSSPTSAPGSGQREPTTSAPRTPPPVQGVAHAAQGEDTGGPQVGVQPAAASVSRVPSLAPVVRAAAPRLRPRPVEPEVAADAATAEVGAAPTAPDAAARPAPEARPQPLDRFRYPERKLLDVY